MDYEPHQEKADSVTAYYDASDELHRLTRSKHAYLEYFVTMQYLEKVIPQNSSILDCCAGTGVYAFELAKKHRVVASDLSGKHVRQMREIQKGKPVLEAVYQLDVCRMDCFEDESFDVVIVSNALHIVPQPEKALQEIKRVLKDDGVLIAPTFTHAGNSFSGMVRAFFMRMAGFPLHSRWTSEEYLRFLRQNGWAVRKSAVLKASFPLTYAECVKSEV